MIITSECEKCVHSTIDETNKAKIIVYCAIKDKYYYFGQCIPCEYRELKSEGVIECGSDKTT